MCKNFVGRITVITGASTGIGLATARRLVCEDIDHVFITGRRKHVLDAAVAAIGRNVTGVQGDVASLDDLERLYDAVGKHNRKSDIIFLRTWCLVDRRLPAVRFGCATQW